MSSVDPGKGSVAALSKAWSCCSRSSGGSVSLSCIAVPSTCESLSSALIVRARSGCLGTDLCPASFLIGLPMCSEGGPACPWGVWQHNKSMSAWVRKHCVKCVHDHWLQQRRLHVAGTELKQSTVMAPNDAIHVTTMHVEQHCTGTCLCGCTPTLQVSESYCAFPSRTTHTVVTLETD